MVNDLDNLILRELLEEGYTLKELPEKLMERKIELEQALMELIEEVKKNIHMAEDFFALNPHSAI